MTVIKFDNERARQLIEVFTDMYCRPDIIKFVQDGAGNFIMGKENLDNQRFNQPNDEQLQAFLIANNVTQPIRNIVDVVSFFGSEIEYVPLPDPIE